MKLLPWPDPGRLAASEPERVDLSEDRLVWRIYFAGEPHPSSWDDFRFFGPLPSRFDHHLPNPAGPTTGPRGVYYCAPELRTALAETFQRKRHVGKQFRQPRAVAWFPRAATSLLDLTSVWTIRAGCDQRIHSTADRDSTREWSRAIYDQFPQVAGLQYLARYCGRLSWCLFERSLDDLPAEPVIDLPLDHDRLRRPIESACRSLGYSFDP